MLKSHLAVIICIMLVLPNGCLLQLVDQEVCQCSYVVCGGVQLPACWGVA